MSVQDLPLLALFTRLQKAGLPLGVDEYKLLLCAVQAGFGMSDKATLKRLCRTLWIKSDDEGRLFDFHFEQMIPHLIESEASTQSLESLLKQSANLPKLPSTVDSETTRTSEIAANIDDEVQIAQAVLLHAGIDDEVLTSRYISSDEYFPVTRRQMKQSWRYLRRPLREGPPMELDMEATINDVGRKGILLEPVLVPRRINRAHLLLLIDHGGSMIPFHMLSQRLAETALRGGRLGRTGIYYFHNYPMEYLYRDPAHQDYERIEEVLNGLSQRTAVLVFSDAGATRGGFSQERIELTIEFLEKVMKHFRYIAWLNPMPHYRWLGTSAEKVMQYVPMFDLSRRGLDNAISLLCGHPIQLILPLRHKYYE